LAGNCDLDRIRQALAGQVNVELLLGDVIDLAAPAWKFLAFLPRPCSVFLLRLSAIGTENPFCGTA
jgi:hypothetical protein